MAHSPRHIAASFVADAPPGQIDDVLKDIQALTSDPSIPEQLAPALEAYNLQKTVAVELPSGKGRVLVSQYNRSDDGRFFDPESKQSFAFDHHTRKASDVQPAPSPTSPPRASALLAALTPLYKTYVSSHFPPTATNLACQPPSPPTSPSESSTIILQTLSTRSSPPNFLAGSWLSTYTLHVPSDASQPLTLLPTIALTVHYYEDGNVRLESGQAPPASSSSADEAARSEMEIAPKATPHDTARAIVKEIAAFERTYQEGVDRDLDRLAEGAFKQLRRTLPVTLQRMEWDKLEGYRAIRLMGGGGKGATDVKRP